MSEAGGGAPGAGSNGAGEAVEARFRDAMSRHQGGNLDEARGMYEEILRDEPGHADSLHMLGVLAHQEGRVTVKLVDHRAAPSALLPPQGRHFVPLPPAAPVNRWTFRMP